MRRSIKHRLDFVSKKQKQKQNKTKKYFRYGNKQTSSQPLQVSQCAICRCSHAQKFQFLSGFPAADVPNFLVASQWFADVHVFTSSVVTTHKVKVIYAGPTLVAFFSLYTNELVVEWFPSLQTTWEEGAWVVYFVNCIKQAVQSYLTGKV